MAENLKLTAEVIDAAKSEKGGWTKAVLAQWGVGWPPPKGWRELLIAGQPIPQPGVNGFPATSSRPSACPEADLLHEVVMAVIEAGQGHLLAGIEALNSYYGGRMPTVAEVIGDGPAFITGDVHLEDRVYSFRCIRDAQIGR